VYELFSDHEIHLIIKWGIYLMQEHALENLELKQLPATPPTTDIIPSVPIEQDPMETKPKAQSKPTEHMFMMRDLPWTTNPMSTIDCAYLMNWQPRNQPFKLDD
jgi:hypothetical protein